MGNGEAEGAGDMGTLELTKDQGQWGQRSQGWLSWRRGTGTRGTENTGTAIESRGQSRREGDMEGEGQGGQGQQGQGDNRWG